MVMMGYGKKLLGRHFVRERKCCNLKLFVWNLLSWVFKIESRDQREREPKIWANYLYRRTDPYCVVRIEKREREGEREREGWTVNCHWWARDQKDQLVFATCNFTNSDFILFLHRSLELWFILNRWLYLYCFYSFYFILFFWAKLYATEIW